MSHIPHRRCVASGKTYPKAQMLRFVLAGDDGVSVDMRGTLPGRGAWLYPGTGALQRACRGGFQRAFRQGLNLQPGALANKVKAAALALGNARLVVARRRGQLISLDEKQLPSEVDWSRAHLVLAPGSGLDGLSHEAQALIGEGRWLTFGDEPPQVLRAADPALMRAAEWLRYAQEALNAPAQHKGKKKKQRS